MRQSLESQVLLGGNILDVGVAGMATGTSGSRYDPTPSFSGDSSSSGNPPSSGARSNSLGGGSSGGGAGPSAGFPVTVPQQYRPLSSKERRRQGGQSGFVPLVEPNSEVEVVQHPRNEHMSVPVPIVSGAPPKVPSTVPGDDVIQHFDGGRIDPGGSPPQEIPPSYESIPGNGV
jgi:hypothetical protein